MPRNLVAMQYEGQPVLRGELARLIDVLEVIENELDTDRFVYMGMPIWPIIKWEIYLNCYFRGKEKRLEQNWLTRQALNLKQVLKSIIAEIALRLESKPPIKDISLKCSIYYLTYSTSRVKYKNKYYDKFLIPIFELFSQLSDRNGQIFRLEGAEYCTNGIHLHPRSDYATPLNTLYLKNYLLATLKTHFTKDLDKIQADLAPVNHILSINSFESVNAKKVLTKSHLTYSMFQWFCVQLKKLKPEKIVLSNYVGPIGWGLIYAGSSLNIDSYEFQHGVLDLSPAYRFSLRRGKNLTKLIPNYILVWNHDQARVIGSWAGGKVKTVVTGNIYNYFSLRNKLQGNLKIEYERLIDRIKGYEGVILFSLQDKLYTYEYINDIIMGLVASSIMSKYFFLIRLHPNMMKERAAYVRSFLKYSNTDVNVASDLPLSHVLYLTDLHITVSSSVTIEAAEVGVSTILLSPDYAEFYSSLVKSGSVYVKASGEQLGRLIRDRMYTRSTKSNESEIDSLKVLEEIFLTGRAV